MVSFAVKKKKRHTSVLSSYKTNLNEPINMRIRKHPLEKYFRDLTNSKKWDKGQLFSDTFSPCPLLWRAGMLPYNKLHAFLQCVECVQMYCFISVHIKKISSVILTNLWIKIREIKNTWKLWQKQSYKLNNCVLHPLFLEIFLIGKKLKDIL